MAATLRQRHGAFKARTKPNDSNGVSVSELILEAASTRDERLTAKREAARVARERRIAEAEASYARSIRELAAREPAAWIEVEQLIAARQSKTYEQAVQPCETCARSPSTAARLILFDRASRHCANPIAPRAASFNDWTKHN